jgi:putative Holliday junction resolvase
LSRILAIDFGVKRTGIAVTDELQIIASGLTTVPTDELLSFLENYFNEEDVALVVVGEPKRMNNENSAVESSILEFIKKFESQFSNIPLRRIDERFTSKMAFQTMIDGGLKRKQRKDKGLIDKISATIILQSYLYYQK